MSCFTIFAFTMTQNSVFVYLFIYSLYQSNPYRSNHLLEKQRPCYRMVNTHWPQARKAPPCQAVYKPLHTTVHCLSKYYSVKYIAEIDYKLW